MMTRVPTLCLGLLSLLVALACPWAQTAWAQSAGVPDGKEAQPGPSRGLDFLFEALKIAPDNDTARLIEKRIWALWLTSGSDTADLLMSRVKTAIDEKDIELALGLLDAIIELKPDYIEAWNRRATVYFQKRDYDRAMRDIAQVLSREPRHFGALTGLGMILEDVGREKQALDVFLRALEIDPHLEKVPDMVKELRAKVEGRDI